MGTFLDLQTSIATDLTRSDIGANIKSAVLDAIRAYEADRFWFNTTRSLFFATIAGTQAYAGTTVFTDGGSLSVPLKDFIEIDRMFLGDATIPRWEVYKHEAQEFEWWIGFGGITGHGRSTDYTFVDSTLFFYPTPADAYFARPVVHYRLPTLVNDTDSNAWTNEAENLIRAHAKMILYANVIEDDEGAARMQAQIPFLKGKLDERTTSRMATGRIRSPRGSF